MSTPQPITTRIKPHGCAGCDARWNGFNTAHCGTGGCHRTFTSVKAFDAHRIGNHEPRNPHRKSAPGGRRCADPATVGLVDAGRDYPCWGLPSDGERWWETGE
jgi:hypothetical protein